ncbi:MAG: D-alanyl-D-alanine carboxypeptidase [Solirubrobacterales bacterium]|nr:D-alanyl-D-alanine carboxypeptidase [Solirubrobacterales bacterium]
MIGSLVMAAGTQAADFSTRLTAQLRAAGGSGSGYAVDLTSGRTIWARSENVPRTPASVTKLFTTSAALLKLGARARFETSVLRTASIAPDGTLSGDLWLKGGGDPSLGPTAIRALAKRVKAAGIRRVTGRILGDDGLFDRIRGVPAHGLGVDPDLGGSLSSLTYNHGGSARDAASALTVALRHRGVAVPVGHTGTGTAPLVAKVVAKAGSPSIATLINWTNTPSDNFFAEMLLKDVGALKGAGGSTAAGLRVERALLAGLGVHPRLNDGSGLSHGNKTSAKDVERLLATMSGRAEFVASLALAGRTGTLSSRMTKGAAAGRCRAKTGTLNGVTALAGYCPVKNGGRIAFAVLMNGTSWARGRPRQDRIVQALARWKRPNGWTR